MRNGLEGLIDTAIIGQIDLLSNSMEKNYDPIVVILPTQMEK